MKKIFILILGVFLSVSLAFAIGFHSANEITPGTFTGNYHFDGNIGIGSSAASNAKLYIKQNYTDFAQYITNEHTGSFTSGLYISLPNNIQNNGHLLRLRSGGDVRFQVGANGKVGVGTGSPIQHLHLYNNITGSVRTRFENQEGYYDIGTYQGKLFLSDESNNQNFVILQNGNVGIGNINPLVKLDVEGTAECDGAGCWAIESDIAYKKNIEDLEYGLDEVMKIQPRRYQLKATNESDIGMIAQELELIIPELVNGEEGSKNIGYGTLTPVLINAIQEQQKEIEQLKQRIQNLEN